MNTRARIAKLSLFIKIFSLHTKTFFHHRSKVTVASSMKSCYPDCVGSSGHLIGSHNLFDISVFLHAPSSVQKMKITGTCQGCKEEGDS
jgi:hypothetical protein